MYPLSARIGILVAVLILVVVACNFPSIATPPAVNIEQTAVMGTLSALGTRAAQTSVPAGNTATSQPTALSSVTNPPPQISPTPQKPLVVKSSLCWEGPGPVYEVVSAVKQGERVTLLGRGSIDAWWIIDNPIYHDPCWVMADVLQFASGFNISGLKVFTPPPTPTPTATKTSTPTATSTP
jgi:hypothetical protein